jgi:hypothetical protein
MPTGTYLEADETAVPIEDAKAAWVPLAREALIEVAGEYNGLIKFGDLAEQLQSGSGIRTTQMTHYWIGDVLGQVAHDCFEKGEPLLPSLCVLQSGQIGTGYAAALAATYGGEPPEDPDMAAAEERLKCYRFFGATMPADGGKPTLTRQVASKRRTLARQAFENRPQPVCPTCFLRLPSNGRCDNCES